MIHIPLKVYNSKVLVYSQNCANIHLKRKPHTCYQAPPISPYSPWQPLIYFLSL